MADGDVIKVPLGEMIETLRQELQGAQARGEGQSVAFEIDKVELELKIVVSRKTKGEGKIAFWVLSAGGGLERAGETSHTFKLSLSPVASGTGGRIKVRGESKQPLNRD
jgi:hypothetical protein